MPRHYRGVSAFAMLHENFPIKRFIKCYPPGMRFAGTAILANRFGAKWKHLKLWIDAQALPHGVEVHFMSGPARRNRNPEKFDLWPELFRHEFNLRLEADSLKGLDARINRLKARLEDCINPKTEVFICPELEDNLTDDAFQTLISHFRHCFKSWDPQPRWVRNPCTEGERPFRCLIERHGITRNPCGIYNPDGTSVAFHDGEKYFQTVSMKTILSMWTLHSNARMRLVWPANIQGVGSASSFVYPSVLERQYIVTDNAIKYCREMMNAEG
jgi:hypothetical protein